MKEGIEFIGADQYQGQPKENISFRDIVLKTLQRIGINANCEFRGGYWQQKVIPLQGGGQKITEEYIEDTREIYSNSIEYLHDVSIAWFDKKMKASSKSYEEKIKSLLNSYMKDGKFTDEEKNEFRQKRVRLCRELLQELSLFLRRKQYLKAEYKEDIVD